MDKKKSKRINITMQPALLDHLDRMRSIYGMTRSGYIAYLLIEEMSDDQYDALQGLTPRGYGYVIDE